MSSLLTRCGLVAALMMFGCDDGASSGEGAGREAAGGQVAMGGGPGGAGGAGAAGGAPVGGEPTGGAGGAPVEASEGRYARRMSVDQMRRSIPQLFEGMTWTFTTDNGQTVELFDALSRSLGEADYIEVVTPNNEPTPLFHKFMDDMAVQLCTRAMEERPALIAPHGDDLDANLRFMRLKFHGVYVPEGADPATDGLEDYRRLFNDIAADADARQAAIGVCMAFMTAPEFMAY